MRGLASLFLALALPLGALAEDIFPALAQLQKGYEAGQAYELRVTARADAWPDVAEETLAAAGEWLKSAALTLSVRKTKDSETGLARLTGGGGTLFTLMAETRGGQADMTLEVPGSLAATRYVGEEGLPPWQQLLGMEPFLPDLAEAGDAVRDIAALSLPLLLPYEKAEKSSITIKNAGRGASQLVYALKADEAQALWEGAKPGLPAALGRLFSAVPQAGEAFTRALETLSFTRAFTVKRILDAGGKDLGLQVTGTVETEGKARRLTLFGGRSGSGLYLSLKLPAARGGDTLEVQVSLATKSGSVKGDWRFKSVSGKETLEASGKVDLTESPEENGGRLQGKLTARLKLSGAAKRTVDYELTPDILFRLGEAEGTLGFRELEGRTVLRDLAFSLGLAPVDGLAGPTALSEVWLAQAGEEQTALSARQVRRSLMPALKDFLFTQPLPARLLVLHDFGRERRTDGESVEPIGGGPAQFTVTDLNDGRLTGEEDP